MPHETLRKNTANICYCQMGLCYKSLNNRKGTNQQGRSLINQQNKNKHTKKELNKSTGTMSNLSEKPNLGHTEYCVCILTPALMLGEILQTLQTILTLTLKPSNVPILLKLASRYRSFWKKNRSPMVNKLGEHEASITSFVW